MYVFRCTASTRKDCAGLTPQQPVEPLLRAGAGPQHRQEPDEDVLRHQRRQRLPDADASPTSRSGSCRSAESWGLYWGGYGWSSGCSSPSQVKSSASRDPMHFEFNGTVAQAQGNPRVPHRRRRRAHANPDADPARPHLRRRPATASTSPTPPATITTKCFAPTEVPPRQHPRGGRHRCHLTAPRPHSSTSPPPAPADGGYITAEGCGRVAEHARHGRTATCAPIAPSPPPRSCRSTRRAASASTNRRRCTPSSTCRATSPHRSTASNGNFYTPVAPLRTTDTRTQPFCRPDAGCKASGPSPPGTELRNIVRGPERCGGHRRQHHGRRRRGHRLRHRRRLRHAGARPADPQHRSTSRTATRSPTSPSCPSAAHR